MKNKLEYTFVLPFLALDILELYLRDEYRRFNPFNLY
jgi:hypothetical protein